MTFEITVASVDDVQRMARWAADEGWNPGNTDATPSSPPTPAPSWSAGSTASRSPASRS